MSLPMLTKQTSRAEIYRSDGTIRVRGQLSTVPQRKRVLISKHKGPFDIIGRLVSNFDRSVVPDVQMLLYADAV